MRWVDEEFWKEGVDWVGGIDEAGRGPLAGPVVAAAVILPAGVEIEGVRDSKSLSPKKREEVFKRIEEHAIAIGVGMVDACVIDRINILRATEEAVYRALMSLPFYPDVFLVDALKIDLPVKTVSLVKGDARSLAVGAASVVAKVIRDRIMELCDIRYPLYGFAKKKGYPTREHLEALRRFGPCEIHRRSYRPVREVIEGKRGRGQGGKVS